MLPPDFAGGGAAPGPTPSGIRIWRETSGRRFGLGTSGRAEGAGTSTEPCQSRSQRAGRWRFAPAPVPGGCVRVSRVGKRAACVRRRGSGRFRRLRSMGSPFPVAACRRFAATGRGAPRPSTRTSAFPRAAWNPARRPRGLRACAERLLLLTARALRAGMRAWQGRWRRLPTGRLARTGRRWGVQTQAVWACGRSAEQWHRMA